MSNTSVARAIDVGHGNTKYTTAGYRDDFQCKVFPSLALAPQKDLKLGSNTVSSTDQLVVSVKDSKYVVGNRTPATASPSTARILHDEYSLTEPHMALVRAALYHMRQPKIDMLVLGLPLTTYETHRDALRREMVGGHEVPNWHREKNPGVPPTISVEVEHVKILPQPVGAFYNYSIPRDLYTRMRSQRNLILDVGFGTFDWYLADGNMSVEGRTDGCKGGVSAVINRLLEALNAGKNNFLIANDIDMALRDPDNLGEVMIDGEVHNLNDYKTVISDAIRASVAIMMESVEMMSDVHNIILTGGGAKLFYNEVQKAAPKRKIEMDDNPVFSNVCGFQMAGEQWLRELGR